MSKKIRCVLSVILLCGIPVIAQVNTNSPYSRFGLGELSHPGFAQNLSLGGTGVGLRSNSQINYLNPASYTGIDTMSFLFDFGLFGSQTTYKTSSLDSKMQNYNIHHIAMGFSVSRNWKASIGIVPYSSVGYNITEDKFLTDSDPLTNDVPNLLTYKYKGNGGLNRFYIGNSVRFLKHFSAGVNLTYLFGYMDYSNSVEFTNDADAASTLIQNRLNVGDMVLNFGLQYHNTFAEKYFLTVGAVLDNETKIKSSRTLTHTALFPGTGTSIGDSISINPTFTISSDEFNDNILFPRNAGLGLSFGIKNKLLIAADFTSQQWSKSFIPGKSDTLVNSSSMNFGLEYTPNYMALLGYLNKVHYRVGGYYNNTYLQIKGEQLQDYGISFGVGLPFKGTYSSFNLGVILGQRGTTENGLIKENYGIVNLGITLHDFWFFKRKFD